MHKLFFGLLLCYSLGLGACTPTEATSNPSVPPRTTHVPEQVPPALTGAAAPSTRTATSLPTAVPLPTATPAPPVLPPATPFPVATAPVSSTRRIAFGRSTDGNGDIYVMNVDGSGLTQLTTAAGWDGRASWSPDGEYVAFHSKRDGNYEVYTMQANGMEQTNRTNHPASDGDPVWSPDGRWIAFLSDRTGAQEVYIMAHLAPRYSSLRRICATRSTCAGRPTVPDCYLR